MKLRASGLLAAGLVAVLVSGSARAPLGPSADSLRDRAHALRRTLEALAPKSAPAPTFDRPRAERLVEIWKEIAAPRGVAGAAAPGRWSPAARSELREEVARHRVALAGVADVLRAGPSESRPAPPELFRTANLRACRDLANLLCARALGAASVEVAIADLQTALAVAAVSDACNLVSLLVVHTVETLVLDALSHLVAERPEWRAAAAGFLDEQFSPATVRARLIQALGVELALLGHALRPAAAARGPVDPACLPLLVELEASVAALGEDARDLARSSRAASFAAPSADLVRRIELARWALSSAPTAANAPEVIRSSVRLEAHRVDRRRLHLPDRHGRRPDGPSASCWIR